MSARSAQRINEMFVLMTRGPYPTIQQLMDRFELAERTIFQYLKEMREEMGLEIVQDPSNKVYFIPDPKKVALRPFDLTEQEVRALKVSKQFLSHHAGSAFEQVLYSAINKIADRLPEGTEVKKEASKSDLGVDFKSPATNVSFKFFWELQEAIFEKRSLKIEYYATSSDQLSSRKIDPYRMEIMNGKWYLKAYCHKERDLRTFLLTRIRKLDNLKEHFEFRQDLLERIPTAFQIQVGKERHKVKILFSPRAARYIREQTWHASQQTRELPDGALELTFTCSSLDEVKRWVLYYGAEASVLEPAELCVMVSEELSEALKHYSGHAG